MTENEQPCGGTDDADLSTLFGELFDLIDTAVDRHLEHEGDRHRFEEILAKGNIVEDAADEVALRFSSLPALDDWLTSHAEPSENSASGRPRSVDVWERLCITRLAAEQYGAMVRAKADHYVREQRERADAYTDRAVTEAAEIVRTARESAANLIAQSEQEASLLLSQAREQVSHLTAADHQQTSVAKYPVLIGRDWEAPLYVDPSQVISGDAVDSHITAQAGLYKVGNPLVNIPLVVTSADLIPQLWNTAPADQTHLRNQWVHDLQRVAIPLMSPGIAVPEPPRTRAGQRARAPERGAALFEARTTGASLTLPRWQPQETDPRRGRKIVVFIWSSCPRHIWSADDAEDRLWLWLNSAIRTNTFGVDLNEPLYEDSWRSRALKQDLRDWMVR